MKRTLLALLVLLAMPATASAAFPESYERLALGYWKAAPQCSTGVEYTWVDDFSGSTTIIGAAVIGGCRMWLKTPFWFAASKSVRCALFLHEWGHLIGMQHSARQHSVMRAELWLPRFCQRRGWLR